MSKKRSFNEIKVKVEVKNEPLLKKNKVLIDKSSPIYCDSSRMRIMNNVVKDENDVSSQEVMYWM